MANQYEPLIGMRVVAVREATVFLENGKSYSFVLDGDCCSTSDFTPEGLAAFRELLGRTILGAEDRDASPGWDYKTQTTPPPDPELAAREAALIEKYPPDDTDNWHFLVFTTDKGHITVDWRNMSNGYYDGSCTLTAVPPLHPVVHDAILEGRPIASVNALIAASAKN